MAGLWCVQLGYGNAELAEAGYEALKTLPYLQSLFKTSNPWTIELAAKLASLLPAGTSVSSSPILGQKPPTRRSSSSVIFES